MAKKKKKFNKQVAAFAASALIVVVVGGVGTYKYLYNSYRPAQLRKEGRERMLKGDYAGAYADFGRAASRLSTDMEFLTWFYETSLHRTSYSDTALRDSARLLEAMLATRPNDVPTVVKKLEFDLGLLDAGGLERFDAEQAKRMADLAGRVLSAEPNNEVAIRADALARAMPIFKQDTSLTSADVIAVREDLGKRLDAASGNADLVTLYTLAIAREREVLLRERAIPGGTDVPRVKEMFADLDARIETTLKAAADETKPAEVRARAYAQAARSDQIVLGSGFIEFGQNATDVDKANVQRIYERRQKSIAQAAELVPVTSDAYVALRLEHANALAFQEKSADAERVLKETVDNAPLQWTPRLFLTEFLSDRGRAAEALELLKTDLQPNDNLQGLAGAQFFMDRRMVPLRRAFVRLQAVAVAKPDARAAEIAEAQKDYDLALADGKISENEPYALQVKAALQEIKLDRTGAAQTLTRALEAGPSDRLKLKLQQQLVSLNLAMNQPGAASAMLEQMMRNPSLTPQSRVSTVIQLIDLHIRNNQTEAARVLLDQAKRSLGANNPALLALDIKLMNDPEAKKRALANLPEDSLPQRYFKLKFAGELGDEPTMRRLAELILKENPAATDVAMLWGDYLRRADKRDEAIAVFQAALAAKPDDKTLPMLIRDTQAVTAEDRDAISRELITDPYKRAMFEAERARASGKLEEYGAKLLEAEALDTNKDGIATERLAAYYMVVRQNDKAAEAVNRLASLSHDPAQIRILRTRLAMANNQIAEASAMADSLNADLPNFAPAWILRAQIYQANNQPSQAIEAFETSLGLQPDNLEALRGLVESTERAGQRDKLKRYIDQGLRVSKNSDEFFIDWSLRYEIAYGDPTATIEPRIKRRDADPENPAHWVALAQSYLASSSLKERTGERDAGKDYRAKALEVAEKAYAKFSSTYGFALQAADLTAKLGDVPKAMALIDALGEKPDLSSDVQNFRARFYAEHGKPDLAIKLLSDQLTTGKDDNSIRMQLAQIQQAAGDEEGSLKTLEGAKEAPAVMEMRMNLLASLDRLDEASKLVSDALAKERTVPNLLMAGYIEARRGKLPDAMKLADEAVKLDPENAPARFTRARFYLSERPAKNNDAVADLQVVRKNQPSNVDARLLLSDRLRAVGRTSEATQELELLERDFPSDRRIALELIGTYATETPPRYGRIDQVIAAAKLVGGDSDPKLVMLEATVAAQRGDKARAVAAARQALKLAPNDIVTFRGMLDVMLRSNAPGEVIEEIDRIQKDNSSLYWTYMTRGVALHRLKRDDEAVKEFDRALGLASSLKDSSQAVIDVGTSYGNEYGPEQAADWIRAKLPDEVGTKVLQMRLLMNSGKTDKAIVVGKQVMDSMDSLARPAQISVLSTMGTAYLTAEPPQVDNARTVFARLNEMEPNNMMTLNNLAYAMTLAGSGPSMQEAVEIAKRANELALQTAQPNPYIMDTYGWTLVQAGKTDEGLAVLRQASEAGALPETDYHIGEVYIIQGQKEAAMANLQRAMSKLEAAKRNGQANDRSLTAHIEDAIRRAKLMS